MQKNKEVISKESIRPVAFWPYHLNHQILSKHIEQKGAGILLDQQNWHNQIDRLGSRLSLMQESIKDLAVESTENSLQTIVDELKQRVN